MTQTDEKLGSAAPSLPTNMILEATDESRTALETTIGEIALDVNLLHKGLRKAVDWVTEAEGRISELEDSVKTL